MNRNDFVGTTFCDKYNADIKAFFDRENCEILKKYSTKGSVLTGMEYRPDKVAAYYLGGSNYSWMIDYANDFENGIKDYYLGREILIPDFDTVIYLLKKS